MRLAVDSDRGIWIEVLNAEPKVVEGRLVDGVALFRHPSTDLDIVQIAGERFAEEFRVLGTAAAAPVAHYRVRRGPGVAAIRERDGHVEAVDRNGVVQLYMDRAWAIDARGVRRDAEIALSQDESGMGMTVSVDTNGLAFPIVIDPVWTSAASAPGAVSWPSNAVLLDNGKVLVSNANGGNYVYDPTANTWGAAGGASGNFGNLTKLLSGKVLGEQSGTSSYLYDPSSNIWAVGPTRNVARTDNVFATRLIDGRVLLVGGGHGANLSDVEIYDPVASKWSTVASMALVRSEVCGALITGGRVLIAGGTPSISDWSRVEIYDPVTNKWAFGPSMVQKRHECTPVPLSDGRLLFSSNPDYPSSVSELYDPVANAWSSVALASTTLAGRPGVVKLSSGKVLLAGGVLTPPNMTSTSEVFDPVANTWTLTDSMTTARSDVAISLLGSGRVLVIGGTYNDVVRGGQWLSSAEIYKPADGPAGTSCTSSAECASNFCVDGVCCDSTCSGVCVACSTTTKASGPDGTCGPAKAATDPHASCTDDGSPACANNGLCDGAGACAKYPISTACAPQICTKAADCTSGFCVDGICCDKACTGTCEACTALKKGSGVDGVCGNVAAGTDPRDRCTVDPGFPANCHADGLCDGAGACRTFAPTATVCGMPTCAAGVQKTPACDGAGVCNLGSASCAPFACDAAGAVCAKTCAVDVDCGAGAYCDTGTCKPKKVNGEVASATSQCQSGIVADGVCCNDACTGLCEACDAGTTKGTCTAVVGSAKHGSCPAATGGDPCSGGTCDGKSRTTCAGLPGSSVVCQVGSCGDGLEVPQGLCDGSGTCQAPKARKCDPYVCGAKACLSTCTSGADCVAGSRCDTTTGKCVANGSCSTDLTTATAPTGETTKCYPVLCVPSRGACGDTCQSAADCASPFVCDTQQRCVSAPSLAGASGGCSAGSGRGADGAVALGGIVLALATVRRRRRASQGRRLG